ncbi:uncharacterized protein LOC115750177 [Rhodamnia argentea]|uniref:Uncharacterized protein LOC115750177 n=1 Tax=Rhodamnia argentea TaxID=178133 RepID=A0A8B8Q7Y5_9MYRT|nr:uncharacterized protein LOC115750177 [Rhodamnia argentea]
MPIEPDMNPPLTDSQAPEGKKKPGGMNIFRAAWLRRHRCPEKKACGSIDGDPSSNAALNKVVGSMRPLHLQSHRSPQHTRVLGSLALPSSNEQYEDVLSSPVSTSCKMTCLSSPSSASEEGMSRFASAPNLVDLDCDSEDGDPDHNVEEGDKTIDAKAEQFIAQFYEQMRTQNYNRKVKMSSCQ